MLHQPISLACPCRRSSSRLLKMPRALNTDRSAPQESLYSPKNGAGQGCSQVCRIVHMLAVTAALTVHITSTSIVLLSLLLTMLGNHCWLAGEWLQLEVSTMLEAASPQRNATVCECDSEELGRASTHTHVDIVAHMQTCSTSAYAVLTHLHGNEGLGSAALSCTSGCVCEPAVMRAWEPPIPYTVFLNYPLTNVGGAAEGCGRDCSSNALRSLASTAVWRCAHVWSEGWSTCLTTCLTTLFLHWCR